MKTSNNYGRPSGDLIAADIVDCINNPREKKKKTSCPTELFIMKSANQWIEEASRRPDPLPLWHSLWYEQEICCLFSDSNLGKSLYAVQIGNHIAQRTPVLYLDFESSDKQFQARYTDPETGKLADFSPNFLRCELNIRNLNPNNLEHRIIDAIEAVMVANDLKVVIIDNLTYLCSQSENPDIASRLMMDLISLKRRLEISILVIAHTPKRFPNLPLTQNDLAGSKRLFNFFDSCFAIGRSTHDENLRYVKQLKVRVCAEEYGSDNVIVYEIVNTHGFPRFKQVGFANEIEHLQDASMRLEERIAANIKTMRLEGHSIREIGERLQLSHSKVFRILKKMGM